MQTNATNGDDKRLRQASDEFGSLLQPIPRHISEITLNDLVVSKENIANYLSTVDLTVNKDDVLQQPSSLGLAVIANHYNEQGDQHCSIYIASTMADFKHLVLQIGSGNHGAKAIVIFQPTDNHGEWRNWFYAMHKVVVYLENKNYTLHMFHADSTAYENVKRLCILLANSVLTNIPRIYYTQQPVLLDPEKNIPMHLQTDFWNCGTHAIRIARVIALDPNFLDHLTLANITTDRTAKHTVIQHELFKLPLSLAKCADAHKAQARCAEMYGDAFTPLATHFAKHAKEFEYINKFTRKYLALIATTLLESSQEELIAQITNTDAKNYKAKTASIPPTPNTF